MKKSVSIVIALVMSLVLATGVFAATPAGELMSRVDSAASAGQLDAAMQQKAKDFIKDYDEMFPGEITNETVALADSVKSALKTATTPKEVEAIINGTKGAAGFPKHVDFNNVSITNDGGKLGIKAYVYAKDDNGKEVIKGFNAVSAAVPEYKEPANNGGSNAASTAPATTSVVSSGKVIKNTGVSANSVAVMAVVLASVLGVAVVGVRKMGLLEK